MPTDSPYQKDAEAATNWFNCFCLMAELGLRPIEVAELVGSHSALKHFLKLMTSFTCVMAWLCAAVFLSIRFDLNYLSLNEISSVSTMIVR